MVVSATSPFVYVYNCSRPSKKTRQIEQSVRTQIRSTTRKATLYPEAEDKDIIVQARPGLNFRHRGNLQANSLRCFLRWFGFIRWLDRTSGPVGRQPPLYLSGWPLWLCLAIWRNWWLAAGLSAPVNDRMAIYIVYINHVQTMITLVNTKVLFGFRANGCSAKLYH